MSKGVTITVIMDLQPEAAEAFCAGMPASLAETASRPGFRNIRMLRHHENPNRVLILETWDSVAAYQAYLAWRTERGDMAAIGSALAGPPQIDYWPTETVAL